MVQDLYASAYATSLDIFERCVENLKAISMEAYNWVVGSEPDHWSNAFFGGARYNHMTSNFGQEFYNWVAEVDEKPITQIVDFLRGKIMELIYMRRLESTQWVTMLTPVLEDRLQNEVLKASSLQVSSVPGSTTYEISGDAVEKVDIDDWNCSCKGWQQTGLPCCHAIAVLLCLQRNLYDNCSRFFMTETYRMTYTESINPIPNVDVPDSGEFQMATLVTPPPKKRAPGRPKVKIVEPMDIIKRQLQCSKCKGLGHNKKTCNRVNGLEGPQTPILTGLVNDEIEVIIATDGPEIEVSIATDALGEQ